MLAFLFSFLGGIIGGGEMIASVGLESKMTIDYPSG